MKRFFLTFLSLTITLPFFAQTIGTEEITDSVFDITLKNIKGDKFITPVNKILMPRVFAGYRHLSRHPRFPQFMDAQVMRNAFGDVYREKTEQDTLTLVLENYIDEIPENNIAQEYADLNIPSRDELPIAFGSVIPDWLRNSIESYRWQEDFIYRNMVNNPWSIEYAYWDLPERPRLPEEDFSFLGFMKKIEVATPSQETLPVHADGRRINWLHTFNIGLQLSQAYLSANWYQGGNSYLAFLGNFLWDVQLNSVYYPKALFQSTVSYKLAINSTPEDKFHKYQISEDLFQYNLKAGYKAVHNWYYSFMAQFKTQFLHNYPVDSDVRTASFLSPGELNLGLGMTYAKENAQKTLKLSATISPLSYNLKTCLDRNVDPTMFGIKPGHKTLSDIGSNFEVNFMAKFWGTATYTTRLFFFTDYHSIETDWENTLNFQFTKVFSTQIYAHLRYDTQADSSIVPKWGKLMLKEILSVGISYTFSTK